MELTVYTDASFGRKRAGIGLVFVPQLHENVGTAVQQEVNNANEAEVLAIMYALKIVAEKITVPPKSIITIVTDSQHAIHHFAKSPPDLLKALRTTCSVVLQRIKGHSDDPHNHTADRLAVKARKQANKNPAPPK